MSDFNLGDFLETLPYEGGPGSADEYIANSILAKRLATRNEEIKPGLLGTGLRYMTSTNEKHYVGVSKTPRYQYSSDVAKLEREIKSLQAKLSAKKRMEEERGIAKTLPANLSLSVRETTAEILRRAKAFEPLEPEGDDDL